MQNQQTTSPRRCMNPGLPPDPPCGKALFEDKRADAFTCDSTCGRTLRRAREYAERGAAFWASLPRTRLKGRPPRTSPAAPRRALPTGIRA